MSPSTGEADGAPLYGRVTTDDGAIYEGRLRFGGEEEAFWGHYFNGVKKENPWVGQVPRESLPRFRDSIELFGIEIAGWERQIDLGRPFMTRFGDIARIEAPGRDLRVILKSGTVFDLNRFGADDFADGVRVWDDRYGVVDLDEWGIRTIEFLPTPRLSAVPDRLHGTVRTRHGDFTGFVQWNREESLGSDQLDGHTDDGEQPALRRHPLDCARVAQQFSGDAARRPRDRPVRHARGRSRRGSTIEVIRPTAPAARSVFGTPLLHWLAVGGRTRSAGRQSTARTRGAAGRRGRSGSAGRRRRSVSPGE